MTRDKRDSAVSGEALQVVVVERGVRVLLRVDDPAEHVDDGDETVHLGTVRGCGGIVVREVEEDEPAQVVLLQHMAMIDAEPIEKIICTVPNVADRADAVVGRRALVGASSAPAIALKSEDFPLPVAPASATTVWAIP